MKKAKRSTKKGFTLIELIVVIAILGILAAVLLPKFSGFTDDARTKSAMSEAKNIHTILSTEYANKGAYPADLNAAKTLVGGKLKDRITAIYPDKKGDEVLFKYQNEGDTVEIDVSENGTQKVTKS